ncbi:MAG: insulinase family protein [Gemmatimonadaceae bacterium]|nr:insulinase family protein [Gemmatimonadaceae bacterium]
MRRALIAIALAAAAAFPALGAAGPAPTRPGPVVPVDTMTSSFDVDGIQVILRRNAANDVVAANLYLLGGTRQETEATAGIEPMMLWVSELGTTHYSREALRLKTAQLGSAIVVEPRPDWTMFGFRGVRAAFDSTWMIFADRLMNGTTDSAAVNLIRAQVLSAVRQRRDSPDDLVQYLADSVAFAGQPYGIEPTGTERSIAAITPEAIARYRATQLVKSRMLLVVVGNVSRAQVERLVHLTIGRLPEGNYRWTPPADSAVHADSIAAARAASVLVPRALPTNYILGYYTGPSSTSADYQALRVASAVLGGRLFAEVRSRRNLTYAVEAPFVERAISAGGLYVTTVSPDSVLRLMRREVRNLQNGLVDRDNLEVIVSQFITEYFLNNETNAEQANFLARAQLYRGDWRVADRFVDELRHVTPDDVRRAAQRYMHDVRFAYVGDTTKVSRALLDSF